jgi:hypothetical protein
MFPAALEFRRWLFAKTTEYANERQCWTPAGDRPLAEVPQLKQLLQENDRNQVWKGLGRYGLGI